MPKIEKNIMELLVGVPITNKYSPKQFTEGLIPVYSAETQNDGIKGYCDKADFEVSDKRKEYIVFGDHTRSVNVVKQSFSVMDNVKVFLPTNEKINLDYVKYMWQMKIPHLGYARHWKVAKKVDILMPIDENGEFDYQAQSDIAEQYKNVYLRKEALLSKVDKLKSISVILPESKDIEWEHVKVSDLFIPVGGKMEYSKTWAKNNQGDVPLFSGATSGEFARVNVADYEGEFLTWCIDGLAGYIMYHNEAFSLTCHRGVLLPTEKCVNIDLKYMKYVLEPIFRKRKKGREGNLGKNEYTSLKPIAIKRMKDTVPIPVKKDGTYDVQKQRELANKYEQIEDIKKNILEKIVELSEIVVL